jgi:hypothetical protein
MAGVADETRPSSKLGVTGESKSVSTPARAADKNRKAKVLKFEDTDASESDKRRNYGSDNSTLGTTGGNRTDTLIEKL